MTDAPASARPRLYLTSPLSYDPAAFAERLAAALPGGDVACLRLRLAAFGPAEARAAVAAVKPVAQGRGVALVLEDAPGLALEMGADGVHLSAPAPSKIKEARAAVGPDAIVGAFAGHVRHDGLVAGEAGADYVAFGPVAQDGPEPAPLADKALFDWWSEMIELPAVMEGGLTLENLPAFAQWADFATLGRAVWEAPDAAAALAEANAVLDAARR